jgi:hypothetical protein
MASREFVDSNGVAWRVWGTVPSGSSMRVSRFGDGWLTFECATSLRRLAPMPPKWELASDARLELMCRAASEVRRHTPPFSTPIVEPEDPPETVS